MCKEAASAKRALRCADPAARARILRSRAGHALRSGDNMALDSFSIGHGYRDDTAAAAARVVDRIGYGLGIEVSGIEHLPKGRALLVANHCFGFDIAFAAARIRAITRRTTRGPRPQPSGWCWPRTGVGWRRWRCART